MIELLIFHLHIIGALYAFTKNLQKRSIKEAILALIIVGLIFSIGWALTNPIAWFIMPHAWSQVWFNQNTLSLILLVIPEIIFFYNFFVKDRPDDVSGAEINE